MAVQPDRIVLLHGVFFNHLQMSPMARFFKKRGFDVLNIDYPSTKHDLSDICDVIQQTLQDQYDDRPTHFVGYSYGGMVMRAYLSRHRPPNMGRAVQIATPNKGTRLADLVHKLWIYKKVYGACAPFFVTDQSEFTHLFTPIDYEMGGIAGTFTLTPISSLFLEGKNDGKISVSSTKIDGLTDHISIFATHAGICTNKKAMIQAAHFIEHGRFLHVQ